MHFFKLLVCSTGVLFSLSYFEQVSWISWCYIFLKLCLSVNHCPIQVRGDWPLFFSMRLPLPHHPFLHLPLCLFPSGPPVRRVYSRRPPQQPTDSCSPPLISLPSNPGPSDDLPIALRKGKRMCTYPISLFVSYTQLSSPTYSFITSLDSTSIPNFVHEG